MAGKKTRFKAKKKKENSKVSMIMLYVMVAAMLFSGLYVLKGDTPAQVDDNIPPMDLYLIRQIGNSSIITSVKEIKPEIVVKINTPISFDLIYAVQAISFEGLTNTSFEVGNPVTYETWVDGTYMFFRFTFKELDENRTTSLKHELNSVLGGQKYELMRACAGVIPSNALGGGIDEIYLPCGFDTKTGDYLKIFLLEKTKDGSFEGTIGFTTKKLVVGPIIEAEILNLTGILSEGIIESDLYFEKLSEINTTELKITLPKIIINQTLDNETIQRINSLEGVVASMPDNKTIISFNASSEDIKEIIGKMELNYSLEPGRLVFTTDEDADIQTINNALTEAGIENISFAKIGSVSTASEVLINNIIAQVPDNNNFNAVLSIGAVLGEKINISLNTIQLGDRIYVIGAEEI